MNSIDQKVVEMKFDNSQFESAVSQTMSTLEKFKDKLNFKGTEKGFDKLGRATSDYQYSLQDVGESLNRLEKRFGVVGTVGARIFEKLTDSAFSFVTRGIGNIVGSITQGGMSRAMNLEQAQFQMKGILKDSQRVHEVIYEDILPELQGTPFSLDQAAVVIGQLTASGKTSSEQIKRATRGMAGLAAMTGHSFADVGRIFTKVAGNGVMMAEELNQLSGYGINAAADLAKFYKEVEKDSSKATPQTLKDMAAIKEAFGEFSEFSIREAASKRMIHYGSMAAAMDELYGAHAQKSTQMYTGALEDLKAALARIGAEPAALKLNFLRDACNALVPAVDAVNAVIKPFWKSMRNLGDLDPELEYLAPFEGPLAKKVQEAGWAFQKLFVQLDENNAIVRATKDSYKELGLTYDEVNKVYKDAKTGLEYDEKQALMNPKMLNIITKTTKSFVNVVTALGKVLKSVGEGIKAAFPKVTLDDISKLADKIEEFTGKLILSEQSLNRIKWFTRGLFTPLGLAIRTAVSMVGLLANAFKNLLKYVSPIARVFSSFLGMLGNIVYGLGNLIRDVFGMLGRKTKDMTKDFRESSVWVKLLKGLETACDRLAYRFDAVGIRAKNFLSSLKDLPAFQSGVKALSNVLKTLHNIFKSISDTTGTFIKNLGLSEKIDALLNNLRDFLSAKFSNADENFSQFADWISKFGLYKKAIDLLSGSFTGLTGAIFGLSQFKPLKGLRKWFGELGQIIINIGKSFLEGDFFVDRAKDMFSWFAQYRKLGGRLKNGFIPAVKAFGESLPNLLNFKDWGDLLDSISKKIGSAVKFITKTLGLFGTGVVQDAAKGVENLSKITNNIQAASKNLSNNQYVEPLAIFFEKIGKSFKEWAENMNPQAAKRLILSLAYFGTCLYYLNTINNAAKAFRGLTKIAETIASGIGALGKMANAIAGIPMMLKGMFKAFKLVGYMTAFSVALIGIAAAMFIISQIDTSKLVAAAGVVLGIVVVVIGLLAVVNRLSNKLGESTVRTMLMLAVVIGSIAGTVLAIAGSLKMISTIDEGSLGKAVGSILAIMTVFGIVMGGLALLPLMGGGSKSKIEKAFGNISSAAWALVGIAAGIRSMVEAIRSLADLYDAGNEDSIRKAVQLIEELIVMTGVFAAMAGWGKHGFSAGMAIIPLALGIKVIIGSIIDIAKTLDDVQFGRAMEALKGLSNFVTHLGTLFLMIGIMSALSGVISKGDFVSTGSRGKASALIAIAEIVAGIWVVSKAMAELGTLNDAQIENGIKVLKAFGLIIALVAAVSYFGGTKVAAGAGAFAALAAGMFLLAEGIVVLGNSTNFLLGVIKMFGVFIGLVGAFIGATMIINKVLSTTMDLKTAGAIALIAAGMLGFAYAIKMIAELPVEGLALAIVGLVGGLLAMALVLAAISALSVGLGAVAAVFALLGIATLAFGAGVFLLTTALSLLIPLIIGLGKIASEDLQAGLEILKQAATGLSETFGIMAGGILKAAGALLVLGVALIFVGAGGIVLSAGIIACAVAVFLFAGSLIVLYETLSTFFPSVVKPVESGLGQLVNLFNTEFLNLSSATGNGMDEMNAQIDEKGAEGEAIAEEHAQNTAKKLNFVELMKQNGFEGDLDELAAMTGMAPEKMANAWNDNSGEFTGAVEDTTGDASEILEQYTDTNYGSGYEGMMQLAAGTTDGSGVPIDATDAVATVLKEKFASYLPGYKRHGEAIDQKMSAGMKDNKKVVSDAATLIADAGVPPSRYRSAYTVGSGIASGIAAGISAGQSAVETIARNVANAAIIAAKSKKGANVNSPSKKTIPIGEAIGEGLVVGMERITSEVISSARYLASAGINALSDAMERSASIFDSDLDYTPTITPVVDLTGVQNGVDGINDMFGRDFGINSAFAGGINAALAARSFNDAQNQNAKNSELNKLANSINGMTDTMNSRALNNYITIDGASDPAAFADDLIRSFRLNARTV